MPDLATIICEIIRLSWEGYRWFCIDVPSAAVAKSAGPLHIGILLFISLTEQPLLSRLQHEGTLRGKGKSSLFLRAVLSL